MPSVFSALNVTKEENTEVLETLCLFCSNKVKYIIDFSLAVASPLAGGLPPTVSYNRLP
jgi:hypothetical protein